MADPTHIGQIAFKSGRFRQAILTFDISAWLTIILYLVAGQFVETIDQTNQSWELNEP